MTAQLIYVQAREGEIWESGFRSVIGIGLALTAPRQSGLLTD